MAKTSQTKLQSFLDLINTHKSRAIALVSLLFLFATLPAQNPILSLTFESRDKNFREIDLTLPPPPPIPIPSPSIIAPTLSAKGAIIMDLDSSTVLFAKNPDTQLLPASTTKIMTALVALEVYQPDQIITIAEEERTIGNTMDLVRGEKITVNNLLYGTLVASGNDAALALALSYPNGSYSGFVKAMNQKAKDLNLKNTTFKNVSGVESPGHLTTVSDLAILTQEALKNPRFREYVSTKEIIVTSTDNRFTHQLISTNQLLGKVEGVTGVKTGWTENALECLVTSNNRDGHQIITVVLGSLDRFGQSEQLIDWAFANHTWTVLES